MVDDVQVCGDVAVRRGPVLVVTAIRRRRAVCTSCHGSSPFPGILFRQPPDDVPPPPRPSQELHPLFGRQYSHQTLLPVPRRGLRPAYDVVHALDNLARRHCRVAMYPTVGVGEYRALNAAHFFLLLVRYADLVTDQGPHHGGVRQGAIGAAVQQLRDKEEQAGEREQERERERTSVYGFVRNRT